MHQHQKTAFWILLAGTAITRLWRLDNLTILHDEYSTLFRTGYSSFESLLKYGVLGDVHPAGIQVLMHYYTSWVGYHTWLLKLPFALMGIGVVYLTYAVGRNFFGASAGLLAAGITAFLQYMLQYSHSIRPYISGTLAVLLTVWALSQINTGDKRYRWFILYALAATAAAYNHYFSLMTVGIIAVSAPFILPGDVFKKWVLFSLSALILYMPHLAIFKYHLTKGSPGDWLPVPSAGYIVKYADYITQYNLILQILISLIILTGVAVFLRCNKERNLKISGLMFLWFFFPFGLGYIYSIWKAPMLQFSVLIFGFPFLILALVSFWRNYFPQLSAFLALLVAGVSGYALITERNYFDEYYRDPLRTAFMKADSDRHPLLLRASETHLSYAQRRGWRADKVHLSPLAKPESDSTALIWLEKQTDDTLHLLCFWQPGQKLLSTVLLAFPVVLDYSSFYLADYYKLARGNPNHFNCTEPVGGKNWRVLEGLDTAKLYGGKDEFPIEYKSTLGEWMTGYNDRLFISVEACRIPADALLVADIRKSDTPLYYQTEPIKTLRTKHPGFEAMHLQFDSKFLSTHSDATLAIYIWNRSKDTLEISQIQICKFMEDSFQSPRLHWLYSP